jgi:hypothetical protein
LFDRPKPAVGCSFSGRRRRFDTICERIIRRMDMTSLFLKKKNDKTSELLAK